jgi:hypothetical protein
VIDIMLFYGVYGDKEKWISGERKRVFIDLRAGNETDLGQQCEFLRYLLAITNPNHLIGNNL